MWAGRPHLLLKSLNPEVTHITFSQVLVVKLVTWPHIAARDSGKCSSSLGSYIPPNTSLQLYHIWLLQEKYWVISHNMKYYKWTFPGLYSSSVTPPQSLVSFPSAILSMSPHGPQLAAAYTLRPQRPKGMKGCPQGVHLMHLSLLSGRK